MRPANIQNNFCMNPDKSECTLNGYRSLQLYGISMVHALRKSIRWSDRPICWFWHALSVAEGNVYILVLTPFPRINVSSVFSSADVL